MRILGFRKKRIGVGCVDWQGDFTFDSGAVLLDEIVAFE